MISIAAIDSVGSAAVAVNPTMMPGISSAPAASGPGFSEMLGQGLEQVEQKISHADQMVRAFALDDTVPIHQVTIALEEARIAVELAMQIRSHLVEAYHQIMNTQL